MSGVWSLDVAVDGNQETRLMLLDNGQFIGTVAVQHAGRTVASIRQLFVAEAYRRRGYGHRLLKACMAMAERSGCEAISLMLAANNSRLVVDFYGKLGFQVVAEYTDGDLILGRRLEGEVEG